MDKQNLRLTSNEIGTLWLDYMNDSMAVCALQYFLEKVKDKDICPIVEFALSVSQQHVQAISQIFKNEGFAVPVGYSDADVDLSSATISRCFLSALPETQHDCSWNGGILSRFEPGRTV